MFAKEAMFLVLSVGHYILVISATMHRVGHKFPYIWKKTLNVGQPFFFKYNVLYMMMIVLKTHISEFSTIDERALAQLKLRM